MLHTNPLTLALALLTAFTYVAIYTPLKRVTAIATFVGAFPGAMGPLLGWTAARGRVELAGRGPVCDSFVWQFPHFMAISWLYRDDYARAGIRMLPVVQPDGWSTVAEALFFRCGDDSGEPGSVAAGHGWRCLCRVGRRAGSALPCVYDPLRRPSCGPQMRM